MILYRQALRRGRLATLIWTAVISVMLMVTVLMFPLIKLVMADFGSVMSGFDEVSGAMISEELTNFTTYVTVESSETLGLGGALFAAVTAIALLGGEERDRTAEFLLTHPVSRTTVVTAKLGALVTEIVALDVIAVAMMLLCALIISEKVNVQAILLLSAACLLLHLSVAGLSFGLSALVSRGGVGISLGIVLGFYFLNLVAGLAEKAEFLKYLTPFSLPDSGYIVRNLALEPVALCVAAAYAVGGVVCAYLVYRKKDIL